MTFLSPFKVRSPVFFVELFEAGHEIKYLVVRRVTAGVVLLGRTDDDVHHIGETAAATAALLHRVVDLRGHDELPTVLIEEAVDHVNDFLVGNEVAAAHQHFVLPAIRKVLNFRD
jgi:hypothetical protein